MTSRNPNTGIYQGDYTGIYRGVVKDIADPQERCRCRVQIIGVHRGDEPIEVLPWAEIMQPVGTGFGSIVRYQTDDKVFVMFQNGNRNYPIITGGWIANPSGIADLPPEQSSDYDGGKNRQIHLDRAGNVLEFNANPDELHVKIKSGNAEITVSQADDSIIVEADGPVQIVGDKLNVKAKDVYVEGDDTTMKAGKLGTGGTADGEVNIISNKAINLYSGSLPAIDPLSEMNVGQIVDGAGIARQTKILTVDPNEAQIGVATPSGVRLPTVTLKLHATTLLEMMSLANTTETAGANMTKTATAQIVMTANTAMQLKSLAIDLMDLAGVLPRGGVVCAGLHACAFNGNPHPQGSTIVRAPQ